MNVQRIRTLVAERSGETPAAEPRARFAVLEPALDDDALREYLLHCLPRESYLASGVTVHDARGILDEALGAPGEVVLPFGYVPIASTIGGNVVVVRTRGEGRATVYGADHERLGSTLWVTYPDPATGELRDVRDYDAGHVERALEPLGSDLEDFLVALLTDRLSERLGALDLGA